MTSHEILHSSMLDILFENRNKQYGAYALRKFYASRMGVALAISFSSVLLLLFLFVLPSSNTSPATILPEDKGVKLISVVIPEEPIQPELPAAKPQPAPQKAMVDHKTYAIVPDDEVKEPLPTIDDMRNAVIGNANIVGLPDDNLPTPTVPSHGDGDAAVSNTEPDKPVFDPVEKQPEFPGGVEAWRNFLSRYLQAPDELAAGERRTVLVRFMVSATGEVANLEIVQSAGTSFDREVLRVMKRMPKWTPAVQNGHHIAVSFVQPVTFQGVEE